jgi:hypothetical protein
MTAKPSRYFWIILLALLTACGQVSPAATPTATLTPLPPTVTSVPTITTTPEPQQPPTCTFPLAEIKAEESTPEEYTFSEPQVVLTAPKGNPLNVAQWLPDNQQVLVTEGLHNQYVANNNTAPQQSISLYNIETGESKLYAIRNETGETEMWNPELNGVVYSALNFTLLDKAKGNRIFTRELRVSYGDPDATQLLADNLQFPFVVKPGENEILYLSDKKISKLDKSLKKLSLASFDPAQWDYAKSRRDDSPVDYQMAWQPGTPLVFLYSGAGLSSGGGYTFIFDTTSGSICELNLGGWAYTAHWSMDGRYLAIDRSNGYSFPVPSSDFVVLDTLTGSLRIIDVISQDVKKKQAIDFTWTPDNLHLLVLEDMPSTYDPNNFETIHHELYLVDLTTGQSTPLFPEFKSFLAGGIRGMNSFVWSPDGSKLLVRCPVMGEPATRRFCLISVQNAK